MPAEIAKQTIVINRLIKKSPLGDIIPDLAQEKKLCRFPLVAEPSEEGQ